MGHERQPQTDLEITIDKYPDASDIDRAVHYILFPQAEGIDTELVGENPFVPLDEAVEQMMSNRLALAIVADEHNVDIDAHYHHLTSAD